MAKETTYAGVIGELDGLAATLLANAGELPHLEAQRAKLERLLGQVKDVSKEQATLIAAKQDASQRLKSLVGDSRRLGTLLRKALVEHYGIRAEKLAEFGLQPFRGKARKVKPETPAPTPSPTPPALPAGSHS